MASVILRCIDAAVIPLIVSFLSVIMNTCLNYLLIFGKFGCPALGASGAAIASVIAQTAAFVLTTGLFIMILRKKHMRMPFGIRFAKQERNMYFSILAPILICEFMWSLGENVYAAIYGHLGTDECAAMTMTEPIQGLMISIVIFREKNGCAAWNK